MNKIINNEDRLELQDSDVVEIEDIGGRKFKIAVKHLKGSGGGDEGKDGATYTPTLELLEDNKVKISYTNNQGLPNPDPVILTAPSGANGITPEITVATDTSTEYILNIKIGDIIITTPNLKGQNSSSIVQESSIIINDINI